jgi:heparan-alpha-glucosaminide N-acetyltransferase
VRPAGANTLLTYLLPDFFYSSCASLVAAHFNTGWPGTARSVAITGVILAVAGLLTKWNVRMQL